MRLDETTVGALTGLPVLLLALAAVPGSLLISRLGPRRALMAGLCLIALAGAARGLGPSTVVLFVMTFLMGAGVAVCQPSLPSLVAQWLKERIGLATATYSNGLLVGEIVASSLTVPLILPLVRHSWQLSLAAWSVPVLATALLIQLAGPAAPAATAAGSRDWWPNWRNPQTWRLGFLLGGGQIAYWGPNAFIPDYLKTTAHAGLIPAALAAINFLQLPASFLVALLPGKFIKRRWPLFLGGLLSAIWAAGLAFTTGGWTVIWAGLLGFTAALIFILNLALPPLLTESHDVHRLTAAMFTISYSCAFLGPLLGGAFWDATHVPATAFIPVAAGGLTCAWLSLGLDLSPASRVSGPRSPARTRDSGPGTRG
ncbi:MAG: MFS transporter [Chloroflexota bacterium]|nr:MFS transporter [Chloroflexota bacterium]